MTGKTALFSVDVLVLYNLTTGVQRGMPTDSLPDMDEDAVRAVVTALEELGYAPRTLGITYDNLSVLETIDAEFVLNLCEGNGLDGHPGLEVVELLARRGLRFSGAGPSYYWLSTGKWLTKQRLTAARVPTPFGAVMPSPQAPLPPELRFPLLVKPRDAFGSLGIDESSVVHDLSSLRAAVQRVVEELETDALVEEYIDGRELTVAVLGKGRQLVAARPLELQFGQAYNGKPRIRTFSSKFEEGSELYNGYEMICPAPLDHADEERVVQTACRAYRAIGGDSYGRIDIRLAVDGTPFVLEVNANCCLDIGPTPQEGGTFPLMTSSVGWSYAEMFERIIQAGLARRVTRPGPPFAARWHRGRTSVHALRPLLAGKLVMPLGALYPAAPGDRSARTLRTVSGARVHIEPHVRHLAHSDEPTLEVVERDGELWLAATSSVETGEELTLDRNLPLRPPLLRAPLPQGRRLRCRHEVSTNLRPEPPLGRPA